jgi:hypothetical protein
MAFRVERLVERGHLVLGAARNGAIFGGFGRRQRRQAAEPPALADPWARTR